MNVPTIRQYMPPVTVQVQRLTTVSTTMHPVKVQRVPLKSPGGKNIPSIKALPPQPVLPSLNTWIHYPSLRHTRAAELSQLVIQ